MKTWYNQRARQRIFKAGDKVLILSPVQGQPLQARYSGPFTIEEKIHDVDYVVNTPGRCKEKRLCHVNMLKLYQERESNEASPSCRAVCSVSVGVNDDIEFREPKLSNSEILQNLQRKLSHLTTEEQNDMKKLLLEFHHLFPNVPSRTTCVYHDVDVDVESAHPCKQHPYRVNPIKLEYLQKEVEYMLENNIIKPSQSEWSSPCILVPKPDGTFRFCTDFRKLNAVTKADSYPFPRLDDCIDRIGKAKYVTTLTF